MTSTEPAPTPETDNLPTRIKNVLIYRGADFLWDFRDDSIPVDAVVFMKVYSRRNFKGESEISIWTAKRNSVTGLWEFDIPIENVVASGVEHGSIYKLYRQDDLRDRRTRRPIRQAGRLVFQ